MKRVAVVGFGFMGITHTMNILKNKDLKLVAIIDANPALIEKNLDAKTGNFATGNINASEIASIHRYSDLENCLQSENLDAVIICVHSGLHYEMTRNALLHDKHVFLEKPLCLDISEGEELLRLAEGKKKILMVGHVVRFMPPYQKLKRWNDSHEFGNLNFLSLSRFCGLPGWGQWKEKQIKDASGGGLFDLLIHDIDFANYLLGLPLDIKCSYLPGEYSKHDYISAMWSYKVKNIHVKIEGGFIFHKSFPFQAGYMAQFEKASILYTSLKGDIIQVADDIGVKEVSAGDPGAGYQNEITYFTECMENNTWPKECMPASSLQAVQLCYKHL